MKINQYTISIGGLFRKEYKIYLDKKMVYRAKASFLLKELTIYNTDGREVLKILRPFSFLKMKFQIIVNDEIRAEVFQDKAIGNNLTIESIAGLYFVDGNFWSNDFTIENAQEAIAKIYRKRFASKKYGIAIVEGQDDLFIIGLVLCIDLMLRVKKRRRN